jgi:formylmethanofuran dehydrogenase subunit D
LKELGVKEDANIKISTKYGTVIVKAKQSKRAPHPKIAYMPYGLWANTITDPKTHGTGMPSFKGITAEIQPAPTENVPTVPQILKQTYRKD